MCACKTHSILALTFEACAEAAGMQQASENALGLICFGALRELMRLNTAAYAAGSAWGRARGHAVHGTSGMPCMVYASQD